MEVPSCHGEKGRSTLTYFEFLANIWGEKGTSFGRRWTKMSLLVENSNGRTPKPSKYHIFLPSMLKRRRTLNNLLNLWIIWSSLLSRSTINIKSWGSYYQPWIQANFFLKRHTYQVRWMQTFCMHIIEMTFIVSVILRLHCFISSQVVTIFRDDVLYISLWCALSVCKSHYFPLFYVSPVCSHF